MHELSEGDDSTDSGVQSGHESIAPCQRTRGSNARTREPEAAKLGRQCRNPELTIDITSDGIDFKRTHLNVESANVG